jgi:uncharacterized lipoprotein YmbA
VSGTFEGTPVIAAGLEYIIERAYREMQPYMWAREAVINSLEAEATRIEFTPEWQAVKNKGVYRQMVVDNGWAMNARELDLFRQFGESGKRMTGAPNENYGVGVKSGCWPWNPYGFVVVSRKEGETNMLWVHKTGGEYELRQFLVEEFDGDEIGVLKHVFPAFEDDEHGCDWAEVFPDWVEESGTAIILLGDGPDADTIRGDASKGEGSLTGVTKFLNERLYDLAEGTEIHTSVFTTADKAQWPKNINDKRVRREGKEDARRYVDRRVLGAQALASYQDDDPKTGRVPLSDGTEVEWLLVQPDPDKVLGGYLGAFASRGRIAVVHHGEVYEPSDHHSTYRQHGIASATIAKKVTLFYHVKPLALEEPIKGETLVYDTTGRSSLLANNAQPLPREKWAEEFARDLPEEIIEEMRAERENEVIEASVEDEEAARRLQARFGVRWRLAILRMAKSGQRMQVSIPGTESREIDAERAKVKRTPIKLRTRTSSRGLKRPDDQPLKAGLADKNGTTKGKKSSAGLDLPRVEVVSAERFGEDVWAVAWVAPSKVEPRGLVQVNRDHPVISEQAEHWAGRVPDHAAQEALRKVPVILGEIVACNIAHNGRFKSVEGVGDLKVEQEMRSSASLTNVLLGLIQTDAVIGPKLGYLGKHKDVV